MSLSCIYDREKIKQTNIWNIFCNSKAEFYCIIMTRLLRGWATGHICDDGPVSHDWLVGCAIVPFWPPRTGQLQVELKVWFVGVSRSLWVTRLRCKLRCGRIVNWIWQAGPCLASTCWDCLPLTYNDAERPQSSLWNVTFPADDWNFLSSKIV